MNFIADITTENWKKYELGSYPHLIIMNDNPTNLLAFSENGNTITGIIFPNEGIEFRDANLNVIYFKDYINSLHASFRVWAFGLSLESLNKKITDIQLKKTTVPKNIDTSFEVMKGVL